LIDLGFCEFPEVSRLTRDGLVFRVREQAMRRHEAAGYAE
jgi:hypothetical protein